jgi:formylglycine-generating enzyme required for sulfatase activity
MRRGIARTVWRVLAVRIVLTATSGTAADLPPDLRAECGPEAVEAGAACVDQYEASVWRVPAPTTANAGLVAKIKQGEATLADLQAGGATQLGARGDDYAPCADDGRHCTNDIYAVSLPSVVPAAFITWFQAQEACANSDRRLPTNAEWQAGASGTPDAGPDDGAADCNTTRGSVSPTGARSRCVSARGASDMVGNVSEWVAEWVPLSSVCPGWAAFSNDDMCLAGATTSQSGPGSLVRGGAFFGGSANGPLTVFGNIAPTRSENFVGFRCTHTLPEPGGLAPLAAGAIALAALARARRRGIAVCAVAVAAALPLAAGPARAQCPPDAVSAGGLCIDRFEASVWRVSAVTTTNAQLVRKIQEGIATPADLAAAGAVQLGRTADDYSPCRDDGQNCTNDVFAVSLPSVVPSAFATWFQAQQACANSAKRLPTSAEWQMAANGTPDPGPDNGTTDCATEAPFVSRTGARTSCVSARGAFDMAGNLAEWTADWVPFTTGCQVWPEVFSNDIMCLAGASETSSGPGALLRGGFHFFMGELAGPHAVTMERPSNGFFFIGFRCAR